MISPFDILTLLIDSILIILYFQIMFTDRRAFAKMPIVIITSIMTYTMYMFVTYTLAGEVSVFATLFRTLFSILIIFGLSFFYHSKNIYRILVSVIYTVFISICEELTYYFVLQFTDISIESDSLPETVFVSITIISNLLLFFFIMILHVIRQRKSVIQSKVYTFLLMFVPCLSLYLALSPQFFKLQLNMPDTYFVLVLFLLFINIINYVLLQSIIKAEELLFEKKLLNEQVELQRRKYQELGESYKNIRSFMHDTKNHLFYIEKCVNKKEYDKIIPYSRETISDLESRYCTVNTGNLVIDAFVSNLINQTSKHGITLHTDININNNLIPVGDYHMTIMLGNLLDNAFNACMEEHGGEINLTIKTIENVFSIYITNTYHATTGRKIPKEFDNFDFIHGYGLKNVKKSAEIYSGFCVIDYERDIYSATVIIPLETEVRPPEDQIIRL